MEVSGISPGSRSGAWEPEDRDALAGPGPPEPAGDSSDPAEMVPVEFGDDTDKDDDAGGWEAAGTLNGSELAPFPLVGSFGSTAVWAFGSTTVWAWSRLPAMAAATIKASPVSFRVGFITRLNSTACPPRRDNARTSQKRK